MSNTNINHVFTQVENIIKKNPNLYDRIRNNWIDYSSPQKYKGYCACCGAPRMEDDTQEHDFECIWFEEIE